MGNWRASTWACLVVVAGASLAEAPYATNDNGADPQAAGFAVLAIVTMVFAVYRLVTRGKYQQPCRRCGCAVDR